MPDGAQQPELDRATILALGAMGLGVFVIANDVTALSVALPEIERDFDSNLSTVQWVINAYALIFGVLIVTGGRLADLFGRRMIFFVGAGVFAGFSLLGAVAQDDWWLIACRALMGIGGAMMWPAILGMTYAALPDDKAGLAGGLILGAAGFGNAAGPLIGGFLTDALSWRWILLLNLPVAAIAVVATWRAIHQPKVEQAGDRIDYGGIASITVGLVALLIALDQVTEDGWTDPLILGLFALCAVLLVAFVFIERSMGANALIPRDVAANPEFRSACVAVLLCSAVFFAALLYLPEFMQKMLDYSPFEAGAGMLPMMGVFAVTAFAAGPLYTRLGPKLIVSLGAACLSLGMFLISLIEAGSGYGALLPGMIVTGIGVGLFYSSITTAGVTALDPARASLAGGIVYMFQVAGGSVGLGLTTTVFTTASEDKLAATEGDFGVEAEDAIHSVLLGTDQGRQLQEQFGPGALEVAQEAFAAGMQWAFRMDGLLALGGLAVVILFVGGSLLHRRPAPASPG
jgi:EmrB/QacA subfamily drug resistance transporter